MGLDQYLYAIKYFSEYIEKEKVITEKITDLTKEYEFMGKIQELSFQFLYWRKANHIHKWFVENIQYGKDDCGNYPVSIEELGELMELCFKALQSPEQAHEILPTTSGCFFGGEEYDDYYYETTLRTYKKLKELFENLDKYGDFDFSYSSSW